MKGCAHCAFGFVEYTKFNQHGKLYEFANPCAYCNQKHRAPQVIKRNGKIYWACVKLPTDKHELWYADFTKVEEMEGAQPGRLRERV